MNQYKQLIAEMAARIYATGQVTCREAVRRSIILWREVNQQWKETNEADT